MTYCIDQDQENRLIQDACIEEIYLDGVADGCNGRLPIMADITYLQGYCKGMTETRAEIGLKITVSPEQLQSEMWIAQSETPLLCGQCVHLNNRRCTIKDIVRDQSQYACPQVSVDCPF